MSNDFDFDLFVIGAGSGGVRGGRWSAGLGAKVAICEEDRYGGTCVIRGCVPKKLMVVGSHFRDEVEDAKGFGWTTSGVEFDWSVLKRRRDAEIQRLEDIYQKILDNSGVHRIKGRGVITGPNTVRVGAKEYRAKNILIATGGRPFRAPIEGAELAITSDDFFNLESMPQKVLVVGAGYISVEFAGILNGFGADVSLYCRGPRFLRSFEADIADYLQNEMQKKGVKISVSRQAQKIEKSNGQLAVTDDKGQMEEFNAVILATGRQPNTDNLGLEAASIETSQSGHITVNEHYQTSCPSIYAVGDCVGCKDLTPVALREGMIVAERLFGDPEKWNPIEYDKIATAVFSQPALGTCGLTMEEARAKGFEPKEYRSEFRPLKHTLSGSEERTLMKMVIDEKTQKVLGIHMVGADVGEILQGFAVAIQVGVTKQELDHTIGIHPTSAEELVTLR